MEKLDIVRLESFRYGLGAFCVRQGRKERWGIMDTNGNIVVEPHWYMVHICSPEIVILWEARRENGRFFDIVRRKFIPGAVVYNSSYKRVITRKGDRQGVEDLDGNVLIPHKYKKLWFAGDGFFEAEDFKGKLGVLNPDGTELQPVRYDGICLCDNTLSFVRVADEWFVSDASGERPLKRHYDYLDGFNSQEYCIFGEKLMEDEPCKMEYIRYGLIDKLENILIPATYDYLRWFSFWSDNDRLCCGKAERPFCGGSGMTFPCWRYGVIDCHGREIVPCIYPEPLRQYFNRIYIADIPRMNYRKGEMAYDGYVTGIVDETGRIVLPFRDWQIMLATGESFRVYDRELELYGLYSSSGEELLPIEFDYIDNMGDTLDYIGVCKNDEWYYVNSRNERVLL